MLEGTKGMRTQISIQCLQNFLTKDLRFLLLARFFLNKLTVALLKPMNGIFRIPVTNVFGGGQKVFLLLNYIYPGHILFYYF